MQEQHQQVEAKKRSRSKSPAAPIRGLKREKSVTNNNTPQPKHAPTATIPPLAIQAHEEVKVSQAVLSDEQGELEKLKFELRQTLRDHNLENYSMD